MSGDRYILVVEDEASLRALYSRVLGNAGWSVLAVPDAETALELIQQNIPAVLITDFGLPGMNGEELVKELTARLHDLAPPVILVTAVTGPIERARAGFDAVFRKPFPLNQLASTVDMLAARSRRKASATSVKATDADDVPPARDGNGD